MNEWNRQKRIVFQIINIFAKPMLRLKFSFGVGSTNNYYQSSLSWVELDWELFNKYLPEGKRLVLPWLVLQHFCIGIVLLQFTYIRKKHSRFVRRHNKVCLEHDLELCKSRFKVSLHMGSLHIVQKRFVHASFPT